MNVEGKKGTEQEKIPNPIPECLGGVETVKICPSCLKKDHTFYPDEIIQKGLAGLEDDMPKEKRAFGISSKNEGRKVMMKIFNQGRWGRRDSNPHALLHQILSLDRLPIPALPQNEYNMILNHARLPVPTLPPFRCKGI